MALKVQCSSCGAPYNIDERRIPAAGLKVRCPKCTTTFVVKKPDADAEPAGPPPTQPATPQVLAPKPPAAPAVAAPAAPPGGSSMAAVPKSPPAPAADTTSPPKRMDDDLPAPAAAIGLPAVGRPVPPARPKAVLKGTQLGLGNLVPGLLGDKAPPAAPAADLPAERLPTPAVPPLTGEAADLPAARPAPPRHGVPARPAPPAADLPAARADLPAARADLPSPGAGRTAAGVPGVAAHLPATAPRPAAAAPAAPADLPAPRADLPATRPARPGTATRGVGSFEINLPPAGPVVPSRPSVSDLPAVSAPGVDLPAPRPKAPAPAGGAFGELDLPAVGGPRDLPAVSGAPRADLPAERSAFGELDLPTVSPGGAVGLPAVASTGIGLPSVSGGGGGVGLPSVSAGGGIGLPTPSPGGGGVGLPSQRAPGADLPDLAAHLPAIGTAREPSVVASDFGMLGDFGSAATQQGPGYSPVAQTAAGGFGPISNTGPLGLAAKAEPARDFGEIELPGPAARPAAEPSWAGAGASVGGGFGEIDLGGPPGPDPFGPSPRAATETSGQAVASDFGDLELPGPATSGAAATYTGGPALSGFDSVRPPAPADFGEASIATKSVVSDLPRGEAGGMGFGEVDLGGGGGTLPTDDMEFGGLEQSRTSGSQPPPPAYEAPLPRPRSAEPVVETPKKPSKVGRVLGVGFVVLAVAGALLELNPKLGAYGRFAISDKLNVEKHAALLTSVKQRTRAALGEDSLLRATQAVGDLQGDLAQAPRYQPLIAYAAYTQFAWQLRYGKDAARDSAGRQLLAKLTEPSPERQLAEAVRDAVAGQIPPARSALKSLLASDPKNVDAAMCLGLLELKASAWKDAAAAFEAARKSLDTPAARAGLVLALEGSGDFDKAKKEATALAEKSKSSAVARVFLAQQAWLRDRDEKGALKWLADVDKPPVSTAAAPAELVAALTLRGSIHLERGRVTDATAAFKAAVDAGKGGQFAAPHFGLGEVFLANGQYPQAMAAYDAAVQLQPTFTLAKVGKARALLRQEKALDAKNLLLPLKDPPLQGEIGYWLGQAEEKLSPDKPAEAMKIYEAAIKAQPGEARPYVALANLQSKVGKIEDSDATLAQAMKSVPPSEKLYLSIGDLRFRQERYKLAVEQFDKALELQPENVEALFLKGKSLLRMDKDSIEKGKEALDSVEKKDAKYPGLALELGLYYQKTEQIEKALERYKAALEASPDDVDIELQVARAMVEARDKTAEERLRKVLERCPKSASPDVCISETKHFLGRALLQKGSYADAERYLKEAVDKAESNAQYHLFHAWALLELTRLPDADAEIKRSLELDQSLGTAYYLRAEIKLKAADNAGAIEDAQKALAMNPNRWEAWATMGMAHKAMTQDGLAYKEFERAVGGDPQNPKAWLWRYFMLDILHHGDRLKGAATLAKDCVKYASLVEPKPPKLPKARFFLAMALRGTDDATAKKELTDYLTATTGQSDPDRATAKAQLAAMGAPYTGP